MKKILVSLALLVGVAAGSYMMLSKDNGFNISKYLPEPISNFIKGDKVSQNITEQEVLSETVELEESIVEEVQEESHENSQNLEHHDNEQVTQNKEAHEMSSTVADVSDQTKAVNDAKVVIASPEVVKLEGELNNMNSSISKLDLENEQLQNKFKNMLKKNRELASKLKTIEGEIAVNASN